MVYSFLVPFCSLGGVAASFSFAGSSAVEGPFALIPSSEVAADEEEEEEEALAP